MLIFPALKEEGLFRLSSEKFDYDRLRVLYNKGTMVLCNSRSIILDVKARINLEQEGPAIHSVAALLKTFFRELPNPLLLHQNYQPFLQAQRNLMQYLY
jgi:hypothetical protein